MTARAAALVIVATASALAAGPGSAVGDGNRAFDAGRFAEAIEAYQQAAAQAPELPEVFFNLGAAYYRSLRAADAVDAFERAARQARAQGDRRLEALSRFNLGVSLHRLAQQSPDSGLEAAERAVDAFRQALELDPDWPAAAGNLELARRALHQLRAREQEQSNLAQQLRDRLEQQQNLNRERERLEEQPSDDPSEETSEDLGHRQRELARQTEETAEQAASPNGPSSDMQERLERAAASQQEAAGHLEQGAPSEAAPAQQAAEQELTEALEALAASAPPTNNPPRRHPSPDQPQDFFGTSPEDILDQERIDRSQRVRRLGPATPVDKDW